MASDSVVQRVGSDFALKFSNQHYTTICKVKAIPIQALTGPEISSRMRLPDFKTIGT